MARVCAGLFWGPGRNTEGRSERPESHRPRLHHIMNLSFSKPRAGCRAATAIQLLIAFIVTAGSAFAQCSGYGSSAIVDVNRAKVPTTQINYTVLVSGAWSFLADTNHGGSVTNSNGYDICFSDAGNTSRYNWEIESYDNTTGAASFWVLVPTVNGAASSSD